jgi:hypothetical protein
VADTDNTQAIVPEGMLDVTNKFSQAKPARTPGPRGTIVTAPDAKDVKAKSSIAEGADGESPTPPEKASSDEPEHKSAKAENRYKELADKVKQLESDLARERAEAQKLREAANPAEILKVLKAERPADYDEWSEDDRQAYVAAKAAKHEQDRALPPQVRDQIRKVLLKDLVQESSPDLSRKQAGLVADVLNEFDNRMSVDEAAAVAARRHPDAFAQEREQKKEARPKADPSSFHAQAPGRADGKKMTALDREEAELVAAAMAERNPMKRARMAARVNQIRAQRRG